MNVLDMTFIEEDSSLQTDGNLFLRFEYEDEWCTLLARTGVKWSVRQLEGRSLKVSYKQPVLLQHVGEFVEGSFEAPLYNLLSDISVQQINAWLKQDAIYKVEEKHAYS